MGRLSLPDISKVEDVLNLLLDPQKSLKYMTEFKEVYDLAKLALGDLHTKELADTYLTESLNKVQAADKKVKDAFVQASKIVSDAQVIADQKLHGAQDSLNQANEAVKKLYDEQVAFEEAQTAFDNYEVSVRAELDERFAQYELDHAKLVKDQEEVLRQKERFEKIQAALAV